MLNTRCFLTLLLGALAACSGSAPSSEQRVVVFGVDGLDPEMLLERMAQGMMPNFSKLAETSAVVPLGTSWPPQSPVAWSNFITGVNPGKHGLYDFIHVDRRNYGVLSSMSNTEDVGMEMSLFGYKLPLTGGGQQLTRQFPAFWEVLSEAGVPVYVHRMPANYPMGETTAITFPDMGAPDLAGAASGKAFLWSESEARADKDSDSYYIRKVSLNRRKVKDGLGLAKFYANFYGPENTMLDQDDAMAKLHHQEELKHAAEVSGDVAAAKLAGNAIAKLTASMASEREVATPFTGFVDTRETVAQFSADIAGRIAIAQEGQWSDWVQVDFEMIPGLVTLSGWTRFLFKSANPVEVYASPIQIDPWNPAMPVSTPDTASADLADAIGPYYTQGFPDAYKSYKADLLTTSEFISQSDTVFDERGLMMEYALDQLDATGGMLFFYTGSLDLRCHMLWHCQDKKHPRQEEPGEYQGLPYEQQIDRVYQQVDTMLGRLVERLDTMEADGNPVKFIVMSDHGFAPFRRKMHVNDWLVQEGYLVLKDGKTSGSVSVHAKLADGSVDWSQADVDWSQSKAYTVGFNGIILNRVGREPQGTVTDQEADALLDEMAKKLMQLQDADGTQILSRVLPASVAYSGPMLGSAPDLQLGFNVGYGASDECAIGGITGEGVLANNDSRWSGSHLMDPDLVKGTLVIRGQSKVGLTPSLEDITATLYNLFSVQGPAGLDGQSLLNP
jgi:predicted AlkP superfamily phosphohydrolase/phosphomutase